MQPVNPPPAASCRASARARRLFPPDIALLASLARLSRLGGRQLSPAAAGTGTGSARTRAVSPREPLGAEGAAGTDQPALPVQRAQCDRRFDPQDPAVADRTIEQLADVFRYALRGAESEWALLDDELEFVRAYLEVERARFGSRLHIDVRLGDDVRGARVPTMMVQTLVENAVKHGVALVRGPASVEVNARRDGERLGRHRGGYRSGIRCRARRPEAGAQHSASRGPAETWRVRSCQRPPASRGLFRTGCGADHRARRRSWPHHRRGDAAARAARRTARCAGRRRQGAPRMIRGFIVDDEEPARDRLRRLLSAPRRPTAAGSDRHRDRRRGSRRSRCAAADRGADA